MHSPCSFKWSVLFISTLLLLLGCTSKSITGTYILCSWNYQTLVLNADQTFVETISPEIGNKKEIRGYFEYDGKTVSLHPNPVDLYVDSIKIIADSPSIKKYKTKRNRLVEQTTLKSIYKKCDYTKLDEKSKRADRNKKQNKIRCTTNNPIRRIYYFALE